CCGWRACRRCRAPVSSGAAPGLARTAGSPAWPRPGASTSIPACRGRPRRRSAGPGTPRRSSARRRRPPCGPSPPRPGPPPAPPRLAARPPHAQPPLLPPGPGRRQHVVLEEAQPRLGSLARLLRLRQRFPLLRQRRFGFLLLVLRLGESPILGGVGHGELEVL